MQTRLQSRAQASAPPPPSKRKEEETKASKPKPTPTPQKEAPLVSMINMGEEVPATLVSTADVFVCTCTGTRYGRKGRRRMEDTWFIRGDEHELRVLGVFDGHLSSDVADLCRERMGAHLLDALKDVNLSDEKHVIKTLREAIPAFNETQVRALRKDALKIGGSTACVAVISGRTVYIVNLGDSRGVIGVSRRAKGKKTNVLLTTRDHKPSTPAERKRIEAAGFAVKPSGDVGDPDQRVDGDLAVSRALGDFQYAGAVIADPDIYVWHKPAESKHEYFLALATDGVWDVMTPARVCRALSSSFTEKTAWSLVSTCMKTSDDNATLLVARI